MIEIWRNIIGYEGLYQVSNWGRVKSLARVDSKNHLVKEKILVVRKSNSGYLQVRLYKDGKTKSCYVHRLVGMAFPDLIEWTEKAKDRPFEELEINHKDQNKQNNFVFVGEDGSADFQKTNLEWCDRPYNLEYGDARERMAKTKSKTVYQYTLDGTFVREWLSVNEVERQTGWGHSNISQCCQGKRPTAYGYKWSYDKDFLLLRSDNSNLTSLPN